METVHSVEDIPDCLTKKHETEHHVFSILELLSVMKCPENDFSQDNDSPEIGDKNLLSRLVPNQI